jgi:RNA polymerase sigma-70 factor (ECF subfamily)
VQGVTAVGADEQLLVAARAGDQACFARLIEPHLAAGYRLAVSMLNDRGQAEDVVQEATFRAWRSVDQLRSSSRIRPWFLSIVANRCRSVRSTRWWSIILTPQPGAGRPSPADVADTRADLARALRRLSPEERAAVFLRFYEDMNSQEIGEVLRISASAVRSRIHRALRRLRVDLGEEEL